MPSWGLVTERGVPSDRARTKPCETFQSTPSPINYVLKTGGDSHDIDEDPVRGGETADNPQLSTRNRTFPS